MANEDGESIVRQTDATAVSISPPVTASLFPVFPLFATTTAATPAATPNATSNDQEGNAPASEWLRNTSFTTNLNVINDAVASNYESQHFTLESDSEEDEVKVEVKKSRSQYELLESSPSDSGSESKRKRKKKKKRRRGESSSAAASLYEFAGSSRKPDVGAWTSSSTANSKEYYFDSRGDRDNLAFGSLYKMDVARYKLHYSGKTYGPSYYRLKNMSSILDGDNDVDVLDGKLLSGGRYWSPQFAAMERHRNLKRVRVLSRQKTESSDITDFIPLNENSVEQNSSSATATVVEESWEDEVFRQTKEFNRLTRERPHDEKVWMSFAEFQDKVASMQPQKGARLQTLEKKISILEKATELNPENEELLLSLLKAYQSRDGSDVLIGRWEKILVRNSGNHRLWKEFLRVIQSEFSRFKVSEMRKMFANAIQALSGACNKQHRQVHQSAGQPSKDPVLVHLELGLVDIFISLCRFEWQTGHQELATALLQAEIEYSLFSPSLFLSEQSKRKLFEHFWNGNGARVGEEGALGWSTWLGKEEEERQKLVAEDLSNNEEGGWSGWSEPVSKAERLNEAGEDGVVSDLIAEESDGEGRAIDDYEDTETLLKKLGIDVAADASVAIKDSETWKKWSAEESSRDCSQWMPLRTKDAGVSDGDTVEEDEQLTRIVLYEDVADYLFSISSVEARLSLVSQLIEFYGGRISQWTCTNSSSWTDGVLSLEYISYSLLDNLRIVRDIIRDKGSTEMIWLEDLLRGSGDISMRTNMMRFIRNATLLCLQAFPQNHVLEEAILIAEEMTNTQMNSSACAVTPCRSLAKSLLKSNRQDVLLCGVYAKREAAFGNIDQARKIFDMALSSIDGLSQDFRSKASLLYLWYAEVELADISVGSSESRARAVHILSCLGSGVKYSPNRGQVSSLQQLRARQGFREHIRHVRSLWTRGMIDDFSIALVSAAALFDDLTAGPAAALDILDEAFTMVLPERRRNSYQLELLFNCYLRILSNHHKELKFSKIWEAIVKGLQIYPQSPCLYKCLVEISYFYTSPSKLRWILDDFCNRKQSVTALLFSLSFEMAKGGSNSKQRIRSVFEKSLGYFGNSVVIWRLYVAYESEITGDHNAARRVFFRAIHACPWSKKLWLDGFLKLSSVLTAKELSDLQEVMRDKELNLRTDVYEILLQDEMDI